MSDTFLDLHKEFMVFVENDDEAGARKFLIDNLHKFPEEMQDKLTFAFFKEALLDETKGIEDTAEVQKQGLEVMSQVDKAKKVLDLKSKLSQ